MTGGAFKIERIGITHTGRLPRRIPLLDRVMARCDADFDPGTHQSAVATAIDDCVSSQRAAGIGIVADGEERSGFALYLMDRISGLEPRPGKALAGFKKKHGLFLENFERWLRQAIDNGAMITKVPMRCTGPIEYTGQEDIRRDIANLASAVTRSKSKGAFMVSIAPGAIEANSYYPTEQAFREAMAEAMRAEYKAITDAGFFLQIDDPYLPALYADMSLSDAVADRRAADYIAILNHGLRGLPEDQIRYRVIGGTPQAARALTGRFTKIAKHMLNVKACAYLFEANAARYEEDRDLWRVLRFPAGKILVPSIVNWTKPGDDNPEAIAARIIGFADRVGRDGIVACAENRGLAMANASEGASKTIWSKMAALNDGAQRASRQLWRSRPGVAVRAAAA